MVEPITQLQNNISEGLNPPRSPARGSKVQQITENTYDHRSYQVCGLHHHHAAR